MPGSEPEPSPTGQMPMPTDQKDVKLSMESRESISNAAVDEEFVAWSEMEEGDEQDYLAGEEKDAQLDQLLEKAYSERHRKREKSYNDPMFWLNIMNNCPVETEAEGFFQLSAPFTLKKAHMLYRYLKTGKAKTIPRKFVYEVLIASCKQLEQQSKETGALQVVPAPSNKSERLFVCGDTHGQLQDVLWIFELHNEPGPGNAYLFNGDMADRGANAVEIFMLLLAYKLAVPNAIFMNRGNHEQRDLNERPFANGGGFAWEVRKKYPHDENLIELFQRFFMLLPVASVVGSWAFVIHGGLFRDTEVTLDDIKKINNKRQPPLKLENRDDELLFDALWADPHEGDGVMMGSARGGYSIQFGADVTKQFCKRTGVKSVIRSHQLPKRQRGFEITHNSMLLTIFSASNYGGVCRNRGGVLIFDEKGPAEVKEFYAPPLEEYRTMCDEKLMQTILERVLKWKRQSQLGNDKRQERKQSRKRSNLVDSMWTHLLFETDDRGVLAPRDKEVLAEQTKAWEEEQAQKAKEKEEEKKLDGVEESASAAAGSSSKYAKSGRFEMQGPEGGPRLAKKLSDLETAQIHKHSLVRAPLRSSGSMDATGDPDKPQREASAGKITPAGNETYQVAYLVEADEKEQMADEILHSIRMQICRVKAELISALVAAQTEALQESGKPRSASGRVQPPTQSARLDRRGSDTGSTSSIRSEKHHSFHHTIAYDAFIRVLSKTLPEYKSHFTGVYGPRLLATAHGEEAERAVKGKPVNFMKWVDRFQVTIAYEQYADFKRGILERVFDNIMAKTRSMTMTSVLEYFDPSKDGTMRMDDVVNVLRDLDLGLPERQLQQLVFELGFIDPSEEVEPVELLTLLIHGLSNFKRVSSAGDPHRHSQGGDVGSKLEGLRLTIQSNKAKVKEALGGETVQHLFLKADSDSDGYLSYEETKKVLSQIIEVCGSSDNFSPEELDAICAHIDLSSDGNITFVEFIAAFGLSDAQRSNFASTTDDGDDSDTIAHLAEEMMQQICSSLYERSQALQKAFMYLDDRGDGWINIQDFEEALLLVLASGGKDAAGKDADKQLLMAPQVKDLVASLRKSHLANPSKDPPEIDYNAFIQSFRVIDTVLDPVGS